MSEPRPRPAEPCPIAGVQWLPLTRRSDSRGWLVELFRHDEVAAEFHPVMAYVSETQPGVSRGPHEHRDQADYFCFFGPGTFRVYLWDARPDSPTYKVKQVRDVGADAAYALIVPAGVVHGYKNVSGVPGLVFNAANRLYKGWHKADPEVDEIRHEADAGSPYTMAD